MTPGDRPDSASDSGDGPKSDPHAGAPASGPYAVTLTASDGTSAHGHAFAWEVRGPLTPADPATPGGTGGDSVRLHVSLAAAHAGTLPYTASGLPTGLAPD